MSRSSCPGACCSRCWSRSSCIGASARRGLLRGDLLPAGHLDADRDGDDVAVPAASQPRADQRGAQVARASARSPFLSEPRLVHPDARGDRHLAAHRLQHGAVPRRAVGDTARALRGGRRRRRKPSGRPLPEGDMAAARPDDHVRDVTTFITAFKVFDTVAVMTRGGPMGASEMLLYAVYLEGFQYFHLSYAATLTLIFLAFTLCSPWPRHSFSTAGCITDGRRRAPQRTPPRRAAPARHALAAVRRRFAARARGAVRRRGLHAAAVRVHAGRPRSSRRPRSSGRLSHCGRATSTACRTSARR